MLQTNVLEYLEQSAAQWGGKTAFTDESGAVTFGQMLEQAQGLGTLLAKTTGAVNRPVAVLVDRTVRTLTAMQAVLASGNYYVPVDSKMPLARMRKILTQTGAAALLYDAGDRELAEGLSDCCLPIAMEDGFAAPADAALLRRHRAQVLDVDPVYVIFTSGSTGEPKGIVVSHRSVIDFTEWMTEFCGYGHEEIFANQAPFYFDLSVKDIYQTMKLGATCHIFARKLFSFPLLLVKALEEKQITALNWATSAFHLVASSGALDKCAPRTVRKAALGGEALQAKHVNVWRRALPQLHVINLYGPTEVTVDCTGYHLDRDFADEEAIPLGTACANKQIILLDADLKPVKPGESGEICVRGSGLANGYFGDWEKTGGAFIQNPLNPHYPDRLYRTGDMAVERDGLLYFLSRKDGQIKHMGYRIELGEIEVALHSIPEIKTAVCLYDSGRERIVCVYVGELESHPLAKAMRALVPKYMLPNIYVKLDEMPYNANGKVDRVKLKEQYIHGAG